MTIAPDGSPVRLYRRLAPRTEDAALIHGILPAGATVLDLGCGTGRLAEPLAQLGHPVTGVDNEPGMLAAPRRAALRHATGVRAEITTLDFGRRFDAVLLMSHFVDAADAGFVDTVLRVVRSHLADGGVAVVERHLPGWAATCTESDHIVDGVRLWLRDLHREGGVLAATMRYEFDDTVAEQRFSVVNVDDDRLSELAAAAGMRFESCLNETRTLAVLLPASV
jgi:SAM-dependent methyltransferase